MTQSQAQTQTVVIQNRGRGCGCGTFLGILLVLGLIAVAIKYWYVSIAIIAVVGIAALVIRANRSQTSVDEPEATPGVPAAQEPPQLEPPPAAVAIAEALPAQADELDSLRKLDELHRDGVLSDAEFAAKKEEILRRI